MFRKLIDWLFRLEPKPERLPELRTLAGEVVRPVGVAGIGLICLDTSGQRRYVTLAQVADPQAFWSHFRASGGSLAGYAWEDGTPADRDPPIG